MNFFNALSFRNKLLFSFALIILFFSVVIAVLLASQNKLGDLQDEGAGLFKKSERISQISFEVANIYSVSADAVINGEYDQTHKDLIELRKKKDLNIKDVFAIVHTDADKAKAEEFAKAYNDYLDFIEKELLVELEKGHGLTDTVRNMDSKIDKTREKAIAALEVIYQAVHKDSMAGDEEFDRTFKSGIKLSITIAVVGVVFSLILILVISSGLAKNLTSIATELTAAGDKVNSAASLIASSSEELSQATTEQAASLEETSASVEQISSMIDANTENAKKSTYISEKGLSSAEKGKVVVGNMVRAIEDINTNNTSIMNQIDETNAEIENIVKIINEIGTKTKVINDIVFQTKLLSFNASVEAARAGEQGKGFSVVAEEVGNLANMSGTAALEISNMLDDSIRKVETIVRNSREKTGRLVHASKEKVDAGTIVAQECEEVLNEIVTSVANSSKMVNEISTAGQEQAQGVREITKAVSQLDQVTQQNTANASQSAIAASDLSGQAEILNALVQKLIHTIEGGAVS